MGKIKSKIVKKAAAKLMEQELGFEKNFDKNKKILGKSVSSKRVRNRLAGYLARLKKQKKD